MARGVLSPVGSVAGGVPVLRLHRSSYRTPLRYLTSSPPSVPSRTDPMCYAVVLALIVVVVETEWSFIFRFWKVMEYWAGRGMLQIFVAVMTRAFPDLTSSQTGLILLENIASYMLLACGLVYVIAGFLCIGFLKRARQQEFVSRTQAVRDLEELERRKEELEQLLMAERV